MILLLAESGQRDDGARNCATRRTDVLLTICISVVLLGDTTGWSSHDAEDLTGMQHDTVHSTAR